MHCAGIIYTGISPKKKMVLTVELDASSAGKSLFLLQLPSLIDKAIPLKRILQQYCHTPVLKIIYLMIFLRLL